MAEPAPPLLPKEPLLPAELRALRSEADVAEDAADQVADEDDEAERAELTALLNADPPTGARGAGEANEPEPRSRGEEASSDFCD
jgi:hypothetical protein